MIQRAPTPASAARARIRLALVLLTLPPAACALLGGGGAVPPQGWEKGRGPVVPHDSFPTDCSLCHEGDGWDRIRADFRFDHLAATGVELRGAHARAECLRCHNDRGPVQQYAARGCAGCHEDVHQGRLGRECRGCHGERTWRPEGQVADHASTRFPLVGVHAAVACYRCHPGAQVGNFQRADTRCESCHGDDLARAVDPDHRAQGWVADCQECHAPTAWLGARIDHSFFPLIGAHAAANCVQCHQGNRFVGTPTDCASCHLAEYQNARQPDHATGGFPTNCEQCHTPVAWRGSYGDHSFFPLTGAHATINCLQCHQGGLFRGTPRDCVGCHQDDYDRTTSPDHRLAGYSTDCRLCHTTSTWEGAVVDHTFFPLTGRHATLDCLQCHQGGVFRGTPRDCIGCHQADYDRARNPDHRGLGFPTACQTCHGTTTWQGAVFNHRFPLSGPHDVSCTVCHDRQGSAAYTCLVCHEHSQTRMDDKHREVSGYVYQSTACVSCHPDGRH